MDASPSLLRIPASARRVGAFLPPSSWRAAFR